VEFDTYFRRPRSRVVGMGVKGVIVECVAIVAEDNGREGNREVGLDEGESCDVGDALECR
jgi:hypothetical protein